MAFRDKFKAPADRYTDTFADGHKATYRHLNELIDDIETVIPTPGDFNTDTIGEYTSGSGVTITGQLTPVVNITAATATLTAAQSGSTVTLSKVDGITVTLPTPKVGLNYKIVVITDLTSSNYVITTSGASVLMTGGVNTHSNALLDKVTQFSPDGSDDRTMTMNGGTTGGDIGTTLYLTCLSSTSWHISGVNVGAGVFTTPFS